MPLIQGPSDTKELHLSRWLNEIRKPESLLAPDLLAFSVQVPQQEDDCRNSGKSSACVLFSLSSPLLSTLPQCTALDSLFFPSQISSRDDKSVVELIFLLL